MLDENLKEKSYLLVREFLESINSKSFDILAERFGVSLAIFEEIDEAIKDYLISETPLGLAPYEKIFSLGKNKRPFLDFYEMHEPNRLGIDCTLWSDGKAP